MVFRGRRRKMRLSHAHKKILISIPVVLIGILIIALFLQNMMFSPQINRITGGVVSTANISAAPPEFCNFTFYEGENLISFHCISGSYPLTFLLQNLTGDYDFIFEYNANDASDPWKSYNPLLPSWTVQDLNFLNYDKGYWIMINHNESFNFEGIVNSNAQTTLYQGWNLIGYPVDTAKPPGEVFASIAGEYNMVLQYKKETNEWYYYIPGDNSSTLIMIEPDYGYWINITQDTSWVFP
jgi:hypothetical protein